jgi:hypothetical protein
VPEEPEKGGYSIRDGSVRAVLTVATIVLLLLLLWFGSAIVLWWAYDMGAFVAGGAYDRLSARSWVAGFSWILTGLTALVWLKNRKMAASDRTWRAAWAVCWQTVLVLFLYALLIEVRRPSWSPGRGVDDWAMFFGSLNARFFSETGPLSFLMFVLPCIAVLSAMLFPLQSRLARICLAMRK